MKRAFKNIQFSLVTLGLIFCDTPLLAGTPWENPILEGSIEVKRTHTYAEHVMPLWEQKRQENATKAIVQDVVSMFKECMPSLKTRKITIYPHVGSDQVNAYFTPSENSLAFHSSFKNGRLISTSQSVDIVAHETGHLVLKALQPNWCRPCHPQTQAFDESFGDITSTLFGLWSPSYWEDAVKKLNDQESCIGTDIGFCIRENNTGYTLQNPKSCEEHDLSQPFTNAVYDAIKISYGRLRDQALQNGVFSLKYLDNLGFCAINRTGSCEGRASLEVAQVFRNILVEGVLDVRLAQPTFSDIALSMLRVTKSDYYRDILGYYFVQRKILTKYQPNPYILRPYEYIPGPYEAICASQNNRQVAKASQPNLECRLL